MKKKLVSLLLSLALIASICGCGQKNGADSKESQTQQESVKQTASTESNTEAGTDSLYPVVEEPITVKALYVSAFDFADGRIVWDKLAEITGVNIEWVIVDAETLPVYLAGGDWDFDFIHYQWLDATLINDYGVTGGMFADYNDYLEYMPNLRKTFEDYPEALKAVKETNGAIYRLPYIEISATMTQVRPYYRTDILEEAGIPVPTTTEEFYQALKTLKEKNGVAAFCPINLSEANYWGAALYAAFGPSVNPDFEDDGTGKVVFNRTSEQYKHYLEYMRKLYQDGLMDPEYLTADSEYVLGLAREGKTAFLQGEAHSLTADDFKDGEFHLSVTAPFTSEYDSERKVLAQLPVSANGFFLNAKSENLVPLVKALDIMFATDEVVEGSGLLGESFCYGLRGVHYVKNDDGTYDLITPEGYDGSFTDFQYNKLIADNAGRATDLEGYITSTPGNAQARQIGFRDNVFPYACDNSEVFPSSMLKFTSEEQDVITNKYTDIQSHVDEMKAKFITGLVDIETGWDEYCATIETMGIQDVLKVYQASYERWNQ